MSYIRLVSNQEAAGRLKRAFGAATARAGKVFNIVRTMSPNPETLDASLLLYQRIMFSPSALSRAEREMVAAAVSRANDCYY